MPKIAGTFGEYIYNHYVVNNYTATTWEVTGIVTGDSSTTVLVDEDATFLTDGVRKGDTVTLGAGSPGGETATVVTVDSETQITTTALSGAGTYDPGSPGETYTISNGDVFRIVLYKGAGKKHFLRHITAITDDASGNLTVYTGNDTTTPSLYLPQPQNVLFDFSPCLPCTHEGVPYIIEMVIGTEGGSSLNIAWEWR
jgi:hypothetical protein